MGVPPRYDRAFVTVRVPASLGAPLTRAHVRTALWKPGTIMSWRPVIARNKGV